MSAQAIEDLALMTALIPFDVIVPADFEEAKQAVVAAGKTGEAGVRTHRTAEGAGAVHAQYGFEIGKASMLRARAT
ncbi:MAG: hypothetical protein U0547_09725 [Dehalococcoidia bacterium]